MLNVVIMSEGQVTLKNGTSLRAEVMTTEDNFGPNDRASTEKPKHGRMLTMPSKQGRST